MDFKEYLEKSTQEIKTSLQSMLDNWSKEVDQVSKHLAPLNQAFVDASEGGKRLRGTLVKLGYEMAGGPSAHSVNSGQAGSGLQEILKVSSAFEIFHTAILAHDDVIDLSPIRRGKPSIYQALGGDHYAISQTICLGDIGFFLAVKIISQANFPEDKKNLALQAFSQMFLDTVLGQMLDIELPHLKGERVEEDALTILRLKTARYTLVGPLTLGAILGGADDRLLNDIILFGESLGIAFQIQDDILGVFGDKDILGKSVTSDIEEGKNTLLIIEALKRATKEQKEGLEGIYGRGRISKEGLEEVRRIFKETGALKYSEGKCQKLVSEAKEVIKSMKVDQKYKDLLTQMADFVVNRQK